MQELQTRSYNVSRRRIHQPQNAPPTQLRRLLTDMLHFELEMMEIPFAMQSATRVKESEREEKSIYNEGEKKERIIGASAEQGRSSWKRKIIKLVKLLDRSNRICSAEHKRCWAAFDGILFSAAVHKHTQTARGLAMVEENENKERRRAANKKNLLALVGQPKGPFWICWSILCNIVGVAVSQ